MAYVGSSGRIPDQYNDGGLYSVVRITVQFTAGCHAMSVRQAGLAMICAGSGAVDDSSVCQSDQRKPDPCCGLYVQSVCIRGDKLEPNSRLERLTAWRPHLL